MPECQFRRMPMVKNDVCDPFVVRMAGNRHGWNRQGMGQIEIHCDNALGPTLQQQAGILVEQLLIVPVNACDKEIILLPRAVLNSGNHRWTVAIASLVRDYANGEC